MGPRPIVIIDTSVFIQDALSRTRKGAASQVLIALPTLATIVLCEDIRDELIEIVSENSKHVVPGAAYSGFLFVTAHGLLLRMPSWP